MDESVDRALAWLAQQHQPDGSFRSRADGQPAVTALATLAFLADGHLPGEGPYGAQIDRALEFALRCQRADGLITEQVSHVAVYNHPITCLLLTEAFGMTGPSQAARIRPVVERAIAFTMQQQKRRKRQAVDIGGWRYLHEADEVMQSDLSITGWYLLSLRSAKNAGFDVPAEVIDDAMGYVHRCFDSDEGAFVYGIRNTSPVVSRGMAGAGVLSMSLGGYHDSVEARQSGDWILRHPFDQYNQSIGYKDRYHYSVFYCTHAMLQLGGERWRMFFPPVSQTLLQHQRADGAWPPDSHREESKYGSTYSTALVVLSLTAPNQVLPIFQR